MVKKFKEQVFTGNFEENPGQIQFRLSNLFDDNVRKNEGTMSRPTRRMTKKTDGTVLNRNYAMCIVSAYENNS